MRYHQEMYNVFKKNVSVKIISVLFEILKDNFFMITLMKPW